MFKLTLMCFRMAAMEPCEPPIAHFPMKFATQHECQLYGIEAQMNAPDPPHIWTRFDCEAEGTDL